MKISNRKVKFIIGEEFIYRPPSKDAEPVWLTYVEKMKNGLHRLFSSEAPVLEYHIREEDFLACDSRIFPKPEVSTKYHTFSGGNDAKRTAYEKLLISRGVSII